MGITVAKFGGTSMGNAQAIQSVANIVANTEGQKVAVVSATSGTTDVLIELGSQAVENGSWAQPLKTLIERHEQIV
ncbi:aspartate kinase, partial [Patescibacteria group bacterium]|nr:aspartate kinase [Patescibacteria group bacterium]